LTIFRGDFSISAMIRRSCPPPGANAPDHIQIAAIECKATWSRTIANLEDRVLAGEVEPYAARVVISSKQ
jgi:hypothetical protein